MSKFDSSLSDFWMDNTSGTPVELSAYLSDVSGLPGPRNLNEVTALGDTGAKFHPGIQNVAPSISGHFDDTSSSGPDAMLGALRDHTAALSLEYYPAGKTQGYVSYKAECWVTDYTITSTVGSHVSWTAAIQVHGTVTKGTVA